MSANCPNHPNMKSQVSHRLNVRLMPDYDTVFVWQGESRGKDSISVFENFMLNALGVRIQYLEEIETSPDYDYVTNTVIPNSGGRKDTLFAVHKDDTEKMKHISKGFDISKLEDIYAECREIYPQRIRHYF